MSAIDHIISVLQGHAGIMAFTSGRIYPLVLPQDVRDPAIVLTLIDESDDRHLGGSNGYPVARFILDCVGSRYEDANALGDAVKQRLTDFRGTVSTAEIDDIAHGDIDHFDRGEQGDRWRRRLAFDMRFRPIPSWNDVLVWDDESD